MELYKLIATINNTAEVYTIAELPENFEGVKTMQNFTWNNPIGFEPKFSLDTMRIILADKIKIDEVFFNFGLFASVFIQVQKLQSTGFDYETYANFAIDFESYEVFDTYSEFALKSISTVDFYNNIKRNELQYLLTDSDTLDIQLLYKNAVSLRRYEWEWLPLTEYVALFRFNQNNDSKIYNLDSSLFQPVYSFADASIYAFGKATTVAKNIQLASSGTITITTDSLMDTAKIAVFKNTIASELLVLEEATGINATTKVFDLNAIYEVGEQNYSLNDSLFIATIVTKQVGQPDIMLFGVDGDFSFDLKRQTETLIFEAPNEIKNLPVNTLLNSFFDNNLTSTIPASVIATSSNTLSGVNDYLNVKPTDFVNDICKMFGLILNFKLDGSVEIKGITEYFNALFSEDNAIEITDYRDLSIKYSEPVNASGVSVGSASKDYDYYMYEIDWNKELNFIQSDRLSDNVIELVLSKLRQDFAGVINYLVKKSPLNKKLTKDIFILDSGFGYRTAGDGTKVYDIATPRDVLNSWVKVLSFYFQNCGKDTLVLSSDGGTADNLQLSGVNQLDNLVLNESLRLTPFVYEFTCLIEDVDFSEKILKIETEFETVFIFVTSAETTDNLSEQKITGLKIDAVASGLMDSAESLLTDSTGEQLYSLG